VPVTAKLSRKFYEKLVMTLPTSSWIGSIWSMQLIRSDLRS